MLRKGFRKFRKAFSGSRSRKPQAISVPKPYFNLERLEPRLLLSGTLIDLTGIGDTSVLDLDTGQTAIFQQIDPTNAAGTGSIQSFVRIQTNDLIENGYNTDYRPLQFDENNSPHTKSVLLDSVLIRDVQGDLYYEFLLDINEPDSAGANLLSLDQFQIYLGDGSLLHNYPTFDGHAVLVFDMDADVTNAEIFEGGFGGPSSGVFSVDDPYVGMDANPNAGSGRQDYVFYIPVELFEQFDTIAYPYVYLYSEMGNGDPAVPNETGHGSNTEYEPWVNTGGYEEWNSLIAISISGYKFNDLNGNATWNQPGELGLGDWTINLYLDANDNGIPEPSELYASTVTSDGTTDANGDGVINAADLGYYAFNGLPSGTNKDPVRYIVEEDLASQTGWNQSFPVPPGYHDLILGTSDDVTNINFGNYLLLGSISGYKFEDLNGNGVDNTDPRLDGWTIQLYLDDGDAIFEGGTDDVLQGSDITALPNGEYSFDNLLPGDYWVKEVLQAGWQSTTTNPVFVTLAPGQDVTVADVSGLALGNFDLFNISGTKYTDITGDGITGDDTGLGGVTIFIDKDGSDTLTSGDDSTTTAGNGSWSFSNLDYTYAGMTVFEVLPGGYVQTVGVLGYDIVGTSGHDQSELDFANQRILATRTPGFWQTHLELATTVFNDYLLGSINLGTRTVDSIGEVMGAFWSSPAYNSDGSKRTDPVCKAKSQAVFQAMAAILSSATPGGAPIEASGYSLVQIQLILGGSSLRDIKALSKALGDFNMSGEGFNFEISQGNATPTEAQNIADIAFWDCPL